jgi:oligopeptide transport system permease protein
MSAGLYALIRFPGVAPLLMISAAALMLPPILPHDPLSIDWQAVGVAPFTGNHVLGTDSIGRDLLARILAGTGVSLLIGIAAALASTAIGVFYGAVAGLAGGWVDSAMMRLLDMLYAMPFMFLVIVLIVLFEPSLTMLLIAVVAVEWLTVARIARSLALSLRTKEFVQAAIVGGARPHQVLVRHVVPNLLGPVTAYLTVAIPHVILAESFLSFLGLGLQEPMTSLGILISDGVADMEGMPWLLVLPATMLSALVISLNRLGDALRDRLDPHMGER